MKQFIQKSHMEADQPGVKKVKNQKKYWLLFCLFFIIVSCDEKPPIPEQKFMMAYVDLLIAHDTTTASYSPDSLKTFVLTNHKITVSQYDSMIKYFNEQPEKWIVFFDSVTAYVERLKLKAENQP